MFDVKPVDESGSLDVQKISAVQATVNLASFRPKKQIKTQRAVSAPIQKSSSIGGSMAQSLPPVIGLPSHQDIKEQFDELMSHDFDLGVELTKVGAQTSNSSQGKPRYRIIQNHPLAVAPDPYAPLISAIHQSAKTISHEEYISPEILAELDSTLLPNELSQSAETDVRSLFAVPAVELIARKKSYSKKPQISILAKFKKYRIRIFVAVAVIISLVIIVKYGLRVKHQIVQQSTSAVASLQTAQVDLKAMDFKNASADFFSAYASFAQAGSSLNVFGAGITDILAALPGGSSLKSAKNLLQVGQLLSAAGTSMTTALNAVSKTGAMSDPTNPQVPIGPIVSALKKALLASQQEVAQASGLMADIDSSIIPPDKQAGFDDLKAKLPELVTGVNMSADYAKFFEDLVSQSGYHRYLVMFQNGSELRPTGGFPGTYGVVSFKDGKLDMISVDDVYNLDGQLKENIIPPLQMQHITPNWGMRDSAWYVDYPASARNVEAFYKKESGDSVDGVIVINPEMIQKILAIVGPVDMPAYNLTLDSTNVLTTIQSQVEYGPNRAQPKQILKDFMPLLMNKIYTAGSDKWLAIFNTLVLSMNQKDMLMSFNDLSLESFVTDKGFGGQVHQGDADYVMPVITNIKGSKTDAVTDTSFAITTAFDGTTAVHTLTITRQHNGGEEKFGFYNKQNPAYIRVLVPDGAQLVSVDGNDHPNFAPLIDYAKDKSFVRDDTLTTFETSGTTDTANAVVTYRESGKTEFGFWLITDAGKSKTVTVTYRVPLALSLSNGNALASSSYSLYVQKQPALVVKNFSFSMQSPDGLIPTESYPLLTQKDSGYSYSGTLDNDMTIKVNFK